jgi:hypothetical protein
VCDTFFSFVGRWTQACGYSLEPWFKKEEQGCKFVEYEVKIKRGCDGDDPNQDRYVFFVTHLESVLQYHKRSLLTHFIKLYVFSTQYCWKNYFPNLNYLVRLTEQ